jgi:hypothetical protein
MARHPAVAQEPGRYDRRMSDELFVPADFAVPGGLTAGPFRLEPLGPQHNAADYAAWTASMDHIQATPGFAGSSWPHPMSLADNLGDLERHAQDFAGRCGFTYTVLSPADGDVIGCVYIYPRPGDSPPGEGAAADRAADSGTAGGGAVGRPARVRSWVRADHADLDPVLYRTVLAWLQGDWPFPSVDYAPRP